MNHTRRSFLGTLGLGTAAAAAGASPLLATTRKFGRRPAAATVHRPQIHTPYPSGDTWFPDGRFERYPLWPLAGDPSSFSPFRLEWTAFYRPGGSSERRTTEATRGFYQVFVCRGVVDGRGAGDFFCGWFDDGEFARLDAEEGSVLLVKRQLFSVLGNSSALAIGRGDHDFFKLPFLFDRRDEAGLPFEVYSEFLLGSPFKRTAWDMTAVSQLEFFHEDTVAPSHYHAAPVWHEFVYVQGGQMTPDAYYGTGDHIASLPGCKEGPYLACYEEKRWLPREWPRYGEPAALFRELETPWPKLFGGARDGIYGVLFVHYGPFATYRPWAPANWTTLSAAELGPLG